MLRSLLQALLVAYLCGAGLYAGGCLYVSGVELPLLAGDLPSSLALARQLLRRAGLLLPPLLLAMATSALLWRGDEGWGRLWLAVFLLQLAILGTTLLINVPINVELLSREALPLERFALLRTRWALAHLLRTALSCLALLLGAWAATSRHVTP